MAPPVKSIGPANGRVTMLAAVPVNVTMTISSSAVPGTPSPPGSGLAPVVAMRFVEIATSGAEFMNGQITGVTTGAPD